MHGPGFLGMEYSPFVISDPSKGTSFLHPQAGKSIKDIQNRLDYLNTISGHTAAGVKQSDKLRAYSKSCCVSISI